MKKKFIMVECLTICIFIFLSYLPCSNDSQSVILVGKLGKIECNISDNDNYVSAKGTGTITFYDNNTKCFAAVGHGLKDEDQLLKIENGSIYFSTVSNITKSTNNNIGNLSSVEKSNYSFGNVIKNNDFGIYGKSNKKIFGKEIQIANKSEIKTGSATLYLDFGTNTKKEFNIEITEIYNTQENSNSCFKIKIIDTDLLEQTGGIVKGMSGSPIIQNGKLIGALTKVSSNDVSEGYGIFAEIMLEECKNCM